MGVVDWSAMSVAAVVLAAGAGSRWTGPIPKLLAPFRGHTVLEWAVTHAVEAGLDETIVVVGAADLRAALSADVHVVVNTAWDRGQATSLRAGVLAAGRHGHDAVVVGLGDQPLVGSEAWRRVAASDSPIATATFAGRRRPPVRLAASVWPLLPRRGDRGARDLLRSRPDLVCEVPCPGEPADIDTPADLAQFE